MALVYAQRYIVRQTPPPAKGGMGEIVFCDDPHLNRIVAIKFLQTNQDQKRITDEIRAFLRIRSKHVVQVYDLVQRENDEIGIVQEYLPGDDLRDFPKKAPTLDEYLKTLYQLASGIEDIHRQGLIHRDFKHNNVKYSQERLLKIFDFGLARPDNADDAQTTGFRGTHGYAAPELYVGGNVTFTNAIDVYAFGATALYLAKGSLPEVMRKQRPPDAESWVKSHGFATLAMKIPTRLVPILDQCLMTDPAARPTMSAVRDAIERRLVRWQHRALLVHNRRAYLCDNQNRVVTLAKPAVASITVEYAGLGFRVAAASGSVFVNNMAAVIGMTIPGCSVITLGSGVSRDFITLDVSRPEVVL